MKRFLLSLLLLASSAFADTTVAPLPTGTWTLMRSATNVQTGYATKEACWAAAAVDAEKRKASANYRCRTDLIFAVTYTTAPVVPPKPADDTQTVACSSGTTGTWSQTRTYSLVSNAWVAGAWSPTAAPAGACVAVPVQTWAKMATEGGSFTVAPARACVTVPARHGSRRRSPVSCSARTLSSVPTPLSTSSSSATSSAASRRHPTPFRRLIRLRFRCPTRSPALSVVCK